MTLKREGPSGRKVFVVGGNHDVSLMFRKLGWELASGIDSANLVQFTGGPDVDPYLYGQGRHKKTMFNRPRDDREMVIYGVALSKNKPMAGICRGAQFLNVMCGGMLWQDVDKHVLPGTHEVIDEITGEVFQATSTHHQMMQPTREALIVGTAKESTYRERCDNKGGTQFISSRKHDDYEILYYEKQNCFCFQPHPEWIKGDDLAIIYNNYLETYCFDKEKAA